MEMRIFQQLRKFHSLKINKIDILAVNIPLIHYLDSMESQHRVSVRQAPRGGLGKGTMSLPRHGHRSIQSSSCHQMMREYHSHNIMRLSASRDGEGASNVSLHREVEALAQQIEQREAQLQASYSDQNELICRLEQALTELEIASAQNRELQGQNDSLRIQIDALIGEQATNSQSEELTTEKIGRFAAEKALASSKDFLDIALADLKKALQERDEALVEIAIQQKKISELEEDVILASRDAKDGLHREMEALAEVETQKECISALRSENETLRTRLVELQSHVTFSKNATTNSNHDTSVSSDQSDAFQDDDVKILEGGTESRSIDPEIVSHADAATEAKKRSYEIRAEAALLVETVEDRASELVEKAQREVAILKAELKKVTGSSDEI